MFKSKTVFIVGAGAGVDVDMPLGSSLKHEISQRLDFSNPATTDLVGDRFVHAAIQRRAKMDDKLGGKIDSYMNAARYIKEGMLTAISIDTFIDTHRGNKEIEVCGKLGIVRSILEAERRSKLFFDTNNVYNKLNFSNVSETWFMQFFHLLIRGIGKDETYKLFENVSFINFNYDRCIEHFLFAALMNHFQIPPLEAMKLVESIKIIHPYGTVGPKPFPMEIAGEGCVPFGSADRGNLLELSNNIKTFTEQTTDEALLPSIHGEVSHAKKIVFLGFAFHEQNLDLLRSPRGVQDKRIYASAQGLSDSDCYFLSPKILGAVRCDDESTPLHERMRRKFGCSQIFTEYGSVLAS